MAQVACDDLCTFGDVACGEPISGPFPQTACTRDAGQNVDLYELEIGEDEDQVSIALNGSYDTYLLVYDDACFEVARNDDGGEGLNSFLLLMLEPGTYYIGVSSYATGATGTFDLDVSCGEAAELCTDDCFVGTVSCGETATGEFPTTGCRHPGGRPMDFYEVITSAGPLVIDLTGDFDTYLYFYDSDCRLLGEDDDGGDGLNSHLETDVGEGIYYIGVSSYSQSGAGTFNLDVVCAGGESFCIQCRTGSIRPDETLQGIFPGTECTLPDGLPVDVVGFNLSEPFRGAIRLTGAPFDASVAIFDRRCDEIDFNDDCGDVVTNDACLDVDLEPGPYSIVISCRNPDDAGPYSLSVTTDTGETLFFRGDAGGDGRLQIDDAVRIFGWLFQGAGAPDCVEAADVDNNGDTNLTDGVVILQFLFQGGAAPAPPGPPGDGASCGADPDAPGSPGDLGCESYAACDA